MKRVGKVDPQILEDVLEDIFGVGCLGEDYRPNGDRTVGELALIVCEGLLKTGTTQDFVRVNDELHALLARVIGGSADKIEPNTKLNSLFDYEPYDR